MPAWWQRIAGWRTARTLRRRAIPDELWADTLERFPFLAYRSADDQHRLRRLATLFLADKEFTGIGDLEVDDRMAVAIAAQACLPILHLGLHWYGGFKGIVLHADAVVARREITDDDGVVHQYAEELAGEAMAGGPVMLSWQDVTEAGADQGIAYNVVVHEFAHVLDMGDGEADGVPPLPNRAAALDWVERIGALYDDFFECIDRGGGSVIDPYGAESIDEFFAVATEVFFVDPSRLRNEQPALYELLSNYFQQDPARWMPG